MTVFTSAHGVRLPKPNLLFDTNKMRDMHTWDDIRNIKDFDGRSRRKRKRRREGGICCIYDETCQWKVPRRHFASSLARNEGFSLEAAGCWPTAPNRNIILRFYDPEKTNSTRWALRRRRNKFTAKHISGLRCTARWAIGATDTMFLPATGPSPTNNRAYLFLSSEDKSDKCCLARRWKGELTLRYQLRPYVLKLQSVCTDSLVRQLWAILWAQVSGNAVSYKRIDTENV
jgi:hypothetical protein